MYIMKLVVDESYLKQEKAKAESTSGKKEDFGSEMTIEEYMKKARMMRSQFAWDLFKSLKIF